MAYMSLSGGFQEAEEHMWCFGDWKRNCDITKEVKGKYTFIIRNIKPIKYLFKHLTFNADKVKSGQASFGNTKATYSLQSLG